MKLHWLRDKENNKFFQVFYDLGKNQGADLFTKHHSATHQRKVREEQKYVRDFCMELQKNINSLFALKSD